MQVNKYLSSNERFIKADVEVEQGSDTVYIIDRVTFEELDNMGKTDQKFCLWFRNQDKGFPLNKTNCRMIAENFRSEETDDWVGRKIRLFRTMTSSPTGMVPCIRVRPSDGSEPTDSTDEPSNILQGEDEIPY